VLLTRLFPKRCCFFILFDDLFLTISWHPLSQNIIMGTHLYSVWFAKSNIPLGIHILKIVTSEFRFSRMWSFSRLGMIRNMVGFLLELFILPKISLCPSHLIYLSHLPHSIQKVASIMLLARKMLAYTSSIGSFSRRPSCPSVIVLLM
jgi:hypothetical protein